MEEPNTSYSEEHATDVYLIYFILLGVNYTACLLDAINTVKIDRFTKWDRDRLTKLESIFTIIYPITDKKFRHN